jgi:hypothetical protein
MEGTPCDYDDCQTVDFLPFQCRFCRKQFCSVHRSRFVHNCATETQQLATNESVSTESQQSESFKDKISSVNNRFSNDSNEKQPKDHYAIRSTSSSKSNVHLDDGFSEKLGKYNKKAKEAEAQGNERARRLNNKTRMLLIKQKAVGKDSLIVSQRFYLLVNFEETKKEKYIFVSKTAKLGEILGYISSSYPQLAFGQATRPDHLCLVIIKPDNTTNRNSVISDVIQDGSEIVVAARSIEQVASDQAKSQMSSSEDTNSDHIFDFDQPPTSDDYVKGQRVLYKKNDDTEIVNAQILSVHLDDPPDTYYTIRLDDGSEKQTINRKLRPNPLYKGADAVSPQPQPQPQPHVKLSNQGKTISFKVMLGSKMADAKNVSINSTISDLKSFIQLKTGIEASKQKLTFNGKILQDSLQISESSIKEGDKIVLITRSKQSSCF